MKKILGVLCALMMIGFTASAEENLTASVENIITMSSTADKNVITVAFDLTNTSSKVAKLNVYAAVYNEDKTMYSADTEKEILWADEKKTVLLKINVPDNGKDTDGKIFVWSSDMQPTTEAVPFTVLSNAEKLTDAVISKSATLNEDTFYNNLTIETGKLTLNGHRLFVNGDLIIRKKDSAGIKINNGELIVNGNLIHSIGDVIIGEGSLIVNKDYRIQTQTEKNEEITYDVSYGKLDMTNENDRVYVNGDFYTQSSYSHQFLLTNGIFKLKGNFAQINSSGNNSKYNFYAYGNKVFLVGENTQTVTFESDKSQFNTLVLAKPKESGYVFSREPCWNTLIYETVY